MTERRYWGLMTLRPAADIMAYAMDAEERGLEGMWTIQLPGPAFLPLATAAAATERLKLGTGIALAFTRSPFETATTALDLDVISGGRTVLGLGPSIKAVNEGWHGVDYDRPLDRLREVATLTRQIIEEGHTGKLSKLTGEFHDMDLTGCTVLQEPVRPSIPIYLPALYPRAARMAAEIAEGIAGHPVWSARWIEEKIAPNLQRSLETAGRTRADFDLNVWAYVAIETGEGRALDDARGTVSFYASIPQYEKYFDAHGFGDEARKAAAAAAAGDLAGMAAAVPDAMVHTFAVVGTPDEVRERIETRWQFADSVTPVPPFSGISPEAVLRYEKAIADTLY